MYSLAILFPLLCALASIGCYRKAIACIGRDGHPFNADPTVIDAR